MGNRVFLSHHGKQGCIDNRLPEEININQIGYPISSFRGYTVDGSSCLNRTWTRWTRPEKLWAACGFKDLNGDG